MYIQPFSMEVDCRKIWHQMDVSVTFYICRYCVFTLCCTDMKVGKSAGPFAWSEATPSSAFIQCCQGGQHWENLIWLLHVNKLVSNKNWTGTRDENHCAPNKTTINKNNCLLHSTVILITAWCTVQWFSSLVPLHLLTCYFCWFYWFYTFCCRLHHILTYMDYTSLCDEADDLYCYNIEDVVAFLLVILLT